MNRRHLITLAALLGGGVLSGCSGGGVLRPSGTAGQLADALVPSPEPNSPALDTPLEDFAQDLNRRLGAQVTNIVWSPWSVAMVLAMVRDGASGATASEFSKLLRARDDFDARLADGWRRMAHDTGEPLHAANAVWAQSGMNWKQPFRDKLAALAASLKVADYKANAAAVEQEINAWVADHTLGKISKLLNGEVDPSTRMVLVNAVHFKAPWLTEFTELPAAPFHSPGKSVTATYLQGGEPFEGWRGDGWTAASIPCKDVDFALTVALPDDPAAAPSSLPLSALIGTPLNADRVGSRAMVALTMPAWRLRYRAGLNTVLAAAGIPTAFDPSKADFSAMTDDERLCLSFVVHQATIEVTAKGIEAAAATAAGIRASGLAAEPVKLTLDRPFAYALVHRASRTPLFVGQVADPTSEEAQL